MGTLKGQIIIKHRNIISKWKAEKRKCPDSQGRDVTTIPVFMCVIHLSSFSDHTCSHVNIGKYRNLSDDVNE